MFKQSEGFSLGTKETWTELLQVVSAQKHLVFTLEKVSGELRSSDSISWFSGYEIQILQADEGYYDCTNHEFESLDTVDILWIESKSKAFLHITAQISDVVSTS